MRGYLLLLPLLLCLVDNSVSYKPVILVHGLLSSSKSFDKLIQFIKKAHPGTDIYPVDMFNHLKSLNPMWKQVYEIRKYISPIIKNAGLKGVHLICYSQGGLICRGLLETMPEHNVDTFIALSSPLMGQYGMTLYVQKALPLVNISALQEVCYRKFFKEISICGYWRDPHRYEKYLEYSAFLPKLNNELLDSNSTERKRNFLRLRKLVLIGGPDDEVIAPWQSSHFGFYNEKEEVVNMKDQMVYQKDTFGLQSLDGRGAITIYSVPGVLHASWPNNQTVFKNYIEKWLT
ncbi:lysosomal thioesterase PPT2-B precursor [Xenopus laevis]|uniref:Lysosomal thioesterase PPT2-B n=2 Tax=Xenopus laevis TaxID=8355 RepID=PPT2B_XENLA|nr:lysosomal thioesterase PPT2-B precursor [Xenopus laevis]Q6GNY7.1 RecName: Full=Lysosomal thioesterase PPT2-B; Short=PPT-2-B; Flags: Precursor [Xenopus laevis]AAH73363.1 MGC80782 protein [Xenopus laevis]OCT67866.1 hypothetical protein XELAEV_18039168mg [Xenopus laevis]